MDLFFERMYGSDAGEIGPLRPYVWMRILGVDHVKLGINTSNLSLFYQIDEL